jgi:apolipoprotein D and lipocalin family protein
LPWVRLLGLAWPLLPRGWTERLSPGAASTVLSVGVPLAERLLSPRPLPPLATMPQVDLMRFSGRWFEVARLPSPAQPRCLGSPSRQYVPRFDGRIVMQQRCVTPRGLRVVNGMARLLPGSGGARLQVSHWPPALRWLPMAWHDHWILHVDDDYAEALVGSPKRDTLWLLSRRRTLPPQRVKALVQIAQDRGFAVDRLVFAGGV